MVVANGSYHVMSFHILPYHIILYSPQSIFQVSPRGHGTLISASVDAVAEASYRALCTS